MSLLLAKLVSLDKFGAPITVNFKGEDSFKTVIGAIASIFAYGLVLAFFIVKGNQFWTRDNSNVLTFSSLINYDND